MHDPITLRSGDLYASVSPFGARLNALHYQGASVILEADPARHPTWHDVYPGAIVGPVANRVRGGQFTLSGTSYQMPCNENGMTALHSGPEGLDRRQWSVMAQSDSHLHLRCRLADGDGGLPGNRVINLSYIIENATLTLDITATTDAPTPISIAHHPYWRLGDAADHRLLVNATHYLPVDDTNQPTGQIAPVDGTALDHRTPRPLDSATDHNLCVANAPRRTSEHVATLTGTDGLRLTLHSTEPGLQIYSGAYLPTLPGTDIAPLAGIALEPQGWPDAVNQAAFPSVICTPDRSYHQITRYTLDRTPSAT